MTTAPMRIQSTPDRLENTLVVAGTIVVVGGAGAEGVIPTACDPDGAVGTWPGGLAGTVAPVVPVELGALEAVPGGSTVKSP